MLRDTELVAHTGSNEIDLIGKAFRFSYVMYHLFGEEPNSFRPSLEFIDSRSYPDDIPVVQQILNQASLDKQPYYFTLRIYYKNGELLTLEAHGKVVCDEAGNAVKIIDLVQDTTEHKKTEVVKRKSDERNRNLLKVLQHAPDAYVVMTPGILYKLPMMLIWKRHFQHAKILLAKIYLKSFRTTPIFLTPQVLLKKI